MYVWTKLGSKSLRPGGLRRMSLFLRPDDYCPVNSVTILRMSNANPFCVVQQQIGAMSRGIDPLI
jgi:hypothetical protein